MSPFPFRRSGLGERAGGPETVSRRDPRLWQMHSARRARLPRPQPAFDLPGEAAGAPRPIVLVLGKTVRVLRTFTLTVRILRTTMPSDADTRSSGCGSFPRLA